jgi:hypothetical protein
VVARWSAPNVLVNYWYLRNKDAEYLLELFTRSKEAGMWVLLDSGSNNFHKQEGGDIIEYNEQLVKFVKKYEQYLDAYSEVETVYEDLLTLRTVWMFSDLKPILTIKKEFIKEQVHDTLELSLKFNRYVGLEAGWKDDEYTRWFGEYKGILEREKIRVHGWNNNNIKLPFWSISSSTWVAGQKYGMTYTYEPGSLHIKSYDKTQKEKIRPTLLGELIKLGLDRDLFMSDNAAEVADYNGAQWVAYAQDLEKYNTYPYWEALDENRKKQLELAKQLNINNAIVRHKDSLTLGGSSVGLSIGSYCNTCILGPRCPEFKLDHTCSLEGNTVLKTQADITNILVELLALQVERVRRGSLIEKVQGMGISESQSKEVERVYRMALQIKDFATPGGKVSLMEKLAASMAAGATAGATGNTGILSQLFGSSLGGGGGVGTRKESNAVNQVFAESQKIDNRNVEKEKIEEGTVEEAEENVIVDGDIDK